MIKAVGELTVTLGKQTVRAVLTSELTWSCSYQPLLLVLNGAFNPQDEEWSGPARGRPGAAALVAAAKHFKATYTLSKVDDKGKVH